MEANNRFENTSALSQRCRPRVGVLVSVSGRKSMCSTAFPPICLGGSEEGTRLSQL